MAIREPEKVEVEIVETHERVTSFIPPDRPRKVYAGMWGPLEIGAVAAGSLAFLAALMVYFFFVVPSNRELTTNRSKADSLEAEVISARAKYGEITDTQTQVDKLLTSVDDFETRFLPAVSNGQNSLYQRLNSLILGYGLINTTGPDYAPLETADQDPNQQTDEEKGRARFRSLYPGVYVTTTVEGTYQNLRRFIREIETGNEFVIISSIELAPSDNSGSKPPNTNAPPNLQTGNPAAIGSGLKPIPGIDPRFAPQTQFQTAGPKPQGKMHGETVALHIEMAAYFRRLNFAPMAPAVQQ